MVNPTSDHPTIEFIIGMFKKYLRHHKIHIWGINKNKKRGINNFMFPALVQYSLFGFDRMVCHRANPSFFRFFSGSQTWPRPIWKHHVELKRSMVGFQRQSAGNHGFLPVKIEVSDGFLYIFPSVLGVLRFRGNDRPKQRIGRPAHGELHDINDCACQRNAGEVYGLGRGCGKGHCQG